MDGKVLLKTKILFKIRTRPYVIQPSHIAKRKRRRNLKRRGVQVLLRSRVVGINGPTAPQRERLVRHTNVPASSRPTPAKVPLSHPSSASRLQRAGPIPN